MTPFVFAFKLLIGLPVGLVLALTAIWYVWESDNLVLCDSFAQKMFSGLESYGLFAIPLFVLTG